jgi:hypothetical protein
MATAAGKENHIEKETIEAYLDRYEGLEDDAVSIMTAAMKKCKDGPRADQKDLRAEMKSAGVRMKTFNALWALRQEIRKSTKTVASLEDDDLDQMREFATAMKGTPFGDLIQARLDEPAL